MRVPSPSLRSTASLVLGALLLQCLQPGVILAQGIESSSSSDFFESSVASSDISSSSEAVSSDFSSSEDSSSSEWSDYSESSSVDSESSPSSSTTEDSSSSEDTSSSEESSSSSSSSESSGGTGIDYATMMSRVLAFRQGEPLILADGTTDTQVVLANDLLALKTVEEANMQALSLPVEVVDSQLQTIDAIIDSLGQPLVQTDSMLIPENPSAFERVEDDTTARFIGEEEIDLIDLQEEWMPKLSFLEHVTEFFFPTAEADPVQELPVLADVQADGKEIILNDDIRTLADELDRNPVNIVNYVRSTIAFEPYSTSKKGAIGCLRDLVCNDVDTAALTISLLRASGIPARYRKAAALLTRDQAQSLLGVDNPKSVYYLLSANGRPTYVVGSALPNPDNTTLEQADFSSVTHFYTEWVGVEAFIDYDERGGSYVSVDDFSTAQSDADVASVLQTSQKKTWIYIDPAIQGTTRVQKPLPANVNMLSFVETHLTTADARTPIDHFNTLAGVNVTDPAAQTSVTPTDIPYDILPPTPPYNLGAKNDIPTDAWSTLPDIFRQRVTIELKNQSNAVLLSKTIYAYELQDQEFDITYRGATAQDQTTIDSYGGIYATPPGLVYIVPVLSDGTITAEGTVSARIGESLILSFIVQERNQEQVLQSKTSQKFSVAGNNEGIYMTFSDGYFDSSRQTREMVLLGGNAAIARYYIATLSATQKQLSGVFDQTTVSHFSRAVVTDNRLVSMMNGTPTTFDFKGLTIDAQTAITPASRRTTFSQKSYDLAVLLAAQLSDYEAGIFQELAGLEAVSTIRGVKYAAARPQEYTIYTIDSGNSSLINSLQVSQNTKNNITADVQAGARVITPNKPITNGEFSGIVYASLGPNVLKFAIGEQSQQNGGFTKPIFSIVGIDANVKKATLSDGRSFLYVEGKLQQVPFSCLVENSYAQAITSLDGYSASTHGQPCYKNTFKFDSRSHVVALTDRAAYFQVGSANGYWRTIGGITTFMQQRFLLNRNGLNNAILDGRYKFNTAAGTISWAGHHSPNLFGEYTSADCPRCLTVYYKPTAIEVEDAFTVYGAILGKLEERNYKQLLCSSVSDPNCIIGGMVIAVVGFPTSERWSGGTYNRFGPLDTSGSFQTFLNGDLSIITSPLLYGARYMPSRIADCYFKRNNTCTSNTEIAAGVAGVGYPTSDPSRKSDNITIKQSFQGTSIAWNSITNTVQHEYGGKFLCDEVSGDSPSVVFQAFITGLADSGIDVFTGAIDLLGAVAEGTINGIVYLNSHSLAETGDRFVYLAKNSPSFISAIAAGASQSVEDAIESAGCPARKWYLIGRYVPDVIAALKALETAGTAVGRLARRIDVVGINKTALKNVVDTAAAELDAANVSDSFLTQFRTRSGLAFDDVVNQTQKQGSNLTSTAVSNLQRQTAYGWEFDKALLTTFKKWLQDRNITRITEDRFKHVKLGGISNDGAIFTGGHIYEDLERKIINNLVEAAADAGGNQRITSLSQIPHTNGIRKVYIRLPGKIRWEPKTILPKGVRDEDWIAKAIDVLDTGIKPDPTDTDAFEKLVTLSGDEGVFTFNLRSVKEVDSNQVRTAYPILP
jgi:hypothetical protein